MLGRRHVWMAAAVVAGSAIASALHAQMATGGALDQVTQSYKSAAHGWIGLMVPVAQRTFALLAAVEVAISGLIYGLRQIGRAHV